MKKEVKYLHETLSQFTKGEEKFEFIHQIKDTPWIKVD